MLIIPFSKSTIFYGRFLPALLACVFVVCSDGSRGAPTQPETPPVVSRPGMLVSYLGNRFYPDDFWTTALPESCGIDTAQIGLALRMISGSNLEIHSFLVAYQGSLVVEYYGWSSGGNAEDPDRSPHQVVPGERFPVHSTTKSFVATLTGIAIGEGLLPGVDDPVVPHFPEYQPLDNAGPAKDAITLEDLLTMRSGLEYRGADDDALISTAEDPARFMLMKPVVDTPVGEVWNYSSGGSDLIAALLRKVTGATPLDYADRKLFGPLGINKVKWEASPNGTNHGGWGLVLSAREMARFGELYRNRGAWNGSQIVPAEWTDSATAARCSTLRNGQYGYQFWIPNFAGFFSTRGAYGRNIYVSRELGVVVVLTADMAMAGADAVLDGIVRNYVIPAVRGGGQDTTTPVVGSITLNVMDIGEEFEGQPMLVALLTGDADCEAPPEAMVLTGEGTVAAGSCEISIPFVTSGTYTACAFIDADGNNEPGPGDLASQLTLVVSGDAEEQWSAATWLRL